MATLIPKSLFWCPQLPLTDYLFDFETALPFQGDEKAVQGWMGFPLFQSRGLWAEVALAIQVAPRNTISNRPREYSIQYFKPPTLVGDTDN